MKLASLEQRRQEIIREYGPWTGYNLELAPGLYTMGEGLIGTAEARIARVAQLLADLVGSMDGLRILDLGSHEGGFAVELASQGAEVLALEGRSAHVEKLRFARDALGLNPLEIHQGDMRALDDLGSFDVVLCLGVLYHLQAEEIGPFLEQVARLAPRAIIETQVGLSGKASTSYRGTTYVGLAYREEAKHAGAAIEDSTSFWPTKPSLLNLLSAVGYTSVLEVQTPAVTELLPYVDHLTLVATRGAPVKLHTIPSVDDAHWPERVPKRVHPAQGWRAALRERRLARRGEGLISVLGKRRR